MTPSHRPHLTSSMDSRGVATVTLDRPAQHNAFDDQLLADLACALHQMARRGARVLILAANGPSFSAGADLAWMKRMANYSYEENLADARALADTLATLNQLPLPTIARVQGAAFGGAVGLISCCDFAIASEQAKFRLSEVRLGLIPATISPYVIAAIGARAARRYFLSAAAFDAQQANRLGLVSEVVDPADLDRQVEALVAQLLANGPQALSSAKALIFEVAGQDIDQALIDRTCHSLARSRASSEGQEGLTAFLEQRQPNWTEG